MHHYVAVVTYKCRYLLNKLNAVIKRRVCEVWHRIPQPTCASVLLVPLQVIVVAILKFVMFHQTHNGVNIEFLSHRMNIGTDVMLAAEKQFSHCATKWHFMNAAVGVEVVRTHVAILADGHGQLLAGGRRKPSNELLLFSRCELCFWVLAEVCVVARWH